VDANEDLVTVLPKPAQGLHVALSIPLPGARMARQTASSGSRWPRLGAYELLEPPGFALVR
ncbi:MAG: hypothetical protein ACRCYQ_16150, partial [Nocardioides sp.]